MKIVARCIARLAGTAFHKNHEMVRRNEHPTESLRVSLVSNTAVTCTHLGSGSHQKPLHKLHHAEEVKKTTNKKLCSPGYAKLDGQSSR